MVVSVCTHKRVVHFEVQVLHIVLGTIYSYVSVSFSQKKPPDSEEPSGVFVDLSGGCFLLMCFFPSTFC